MPYKFEYTHKIIPRELNRTVKLSLEDREKIREEYPIIKSQRKLAVKYGVSRRLITLILDPLKELKNKKRLKENISKYYDREKQTEYKRKSRRYKQELNLNGKLI